MEKNRLTLFNQLTGEDIEFFDRFFGKHYPKFSHWYNIITDDSIFPKIKDVGCSIEDDHSVVFHMNFSKKLKTKLRCCLTELIENSYNRIDYLDTLNYLDEYHLDFTISER